MVVLQITHHTTYCDPARRHRDQAPGEIERHLPPPARGHWEESCEWVVLRMMLIFRRFR